MAGSLMESGHWLVAGWTMLHFLWVGALIGLLAAAGRLVLASAGPNTRYVFGRVCLACLTSAPLAIARVLMTQYGPEFMTPAGLAAEPATPEVPDTWDEDTPWDSRSVLTLVIPATHRPSAALWLTKQALRAAARYLPWLWLTGAPLVFMMVAAGLAGAERLGRQSRVLNHGAAPAMCERLRRSLSIARHVAVGVCTRVTCPVLVGILRPAILLPAAAVMGWSAEQLEMVLLHELAHVRRWDNLVNLLQRIVESLLFFHPVVWLVSGWVRREREHCCDQVVLAHTQRPHAYAEMLAAMAAPAAGRLALVAMGEANIVTRIRRVLQQDGAMKLSHKLVGALTCAFIVTALLVGAFARQTSAAYKPEANRLLSGAAEDLSTLARPLEAQERGPAGPLNPGPQEQLTLRLVDSYGTPVEGADVALHTKWKDGRPEFFLRSPCQAQELKSGPDGRVALPWVWFGDPNRKTTRLGTPQPQPSDTPVLVMHVDRELGAIVRVEQANRGQELGVCLYPLSRVRFRLDSAALRTRGTPLIRARGHLGVAGNCDVPFFETTVDGSPASGYEFEYLVPPGRYQTLGDADAQDRLVVERALVPFEVKAGQPELDLGALDLPPARYSLFHDQAAPEFFEVRDVRTNAPLKLVDFRGKVVLLHFSMGRTPMELRETLRRLQGTYRRDGLEVVVIHPSNGTLPSIEPVPTDASLTDAVDGGGQMQVEGTSRHVFGATAASYGVRNAANLFLIDREGRLVAANFSDCPPGATQALLERVLSGQPATAGSAASRSRYGRSTGRNGQPVRAASAAPRSRYGLSTAWNGPPVGSGSATPARARYGRLQAG